MKVFAISLLLAHAEGAGPQYVLVQKVEKALCEPFNKDVKLQEVYLNLMLGNDVNDLKKLLEECKNKCTANENCFAFATISGKHCVLYNTRVTLAEVDSESKAHGCYAKLPDKLCKEGEVKTRCLCTRDSDKKCFEGCDQGAVCDEGEECLFPFSSIGSSECLASSRKQVANKKADKKVTPAPAPAPAPAAAPASTPASDTAKRCKKYGTKFCARPRYSRICPLTCAAAHKAESSRKEVANKQADKKAAPKTICKEGEVKKPCFCTSNPGAESIGPDDDKGAECEEGQICEWPERWPGHSICLASSRKEVTNKPEDKKDKEPQTCRKIVNRCGPKRAKRCPKTCERYEVNNDLGPVDPARIHETSAYQR